MSSEFENQSESCELDELTRHGLESQVRFLAQKEDPNSSDFKSIIEKLVMLQAGATANSVEFNITSRFGREMTVALSKLNARFSMNARLDIKSEPYAPVEMNISAIVDPFGENPNVVIESQVSGASRDNVLEINLSDCMKLASMAYNESNPQI